MQTEIPSESVEPERVINVVGLPRKLVVEYLQSGFDSLRPGQALKVVDDSYPDWFLPILTREGNGRIDPDRLEIREQVSTSCRRYVTRLVKEDP